MAKNFEKEAGKMSLLLAGKESRKFDQVNRIALPTCFRKEIGETAILMKSVHKEPCLMLFTEQSWEDFSYAFIYSFNDPMKRAKAQRRLADRVEKVTVDKSGRISIKDDFKAYAQLTDEACFIGMMDRVEIWSVDNWDLINSDDGEDDDDIFENVNYSAPRRTE